MRLTLTNDDSQPFPAGFGHHPYFVRDPENRVQLQIDCDTYYEMQQAMAVAPAVPLTPRLDFRTLRPLNTDEFNDVYTARTAEAAYRLVYPQVSVAMLADSAVYTRGAVYASGQTVLRRRAADQRQRWLQPVRSGDGGHGRVRAATGRVDQRRCDAED